MEPNAVTNTRPQKQDRSGQIWPLRVPRMLSNSDLDPKALL